MSVYTVLPTTNLNGSDIRDTIGGNNDMVHNVIAAKVNGVGGYAFKVTANQSNTEMPSGLNLGEIIPGSLPLWNIFSAVSPGDWFLSGGGTAQGYIKFRLKTTSAWGLSHSPYLLDLSSFAGYNHAASKPSLYGKSSFSVQLKDGVYSDVLADFYITTGSYHFEDLFGYTIGKVGVVLFKADGTVFSFGLVSVSTLPRDSSVNVQWTITGSEFSNLSNGDKLYPTWCIASSNVSTTKNIYDLFLMDYIKNDITPTTVNIIVLNNPTYSLSIRYIKKDGTLLQAAAESITGIPTAESITLSGVHMVDSYTSPALQRKFIFISTDGANFISPKELPSKTIFSPTSSVNIGYDLDIGYNVQYSFEIQELDELPL